MSIIKSKKVIIPAIVFVIIFIAITILGLTQSIITALFSPTVEVFERPSFPVDYSYIHGVFYKNCHHAVESKAELIVIGEVIRVFEPEVYNEFEGNINYRTCSDIRVDKVIKGNVKPGDIIKTALPGGLYLKDDTLEYPSAGERRILFLYPKASGENAYYPVGHKQGSIQIVNGKTKKTSNSQFIVDGIPEDDLIQALKDEPRETIYETYDMALSESDLVIIGDYINRAYVHIFFDDKFPCEGIIAEYRVDKVLKGEVNTGDTIKVFNHGGYDFDKRNFLFLKRSEDSRNNIFYSPINRYQGIITIDSSSIIRKSNDYQFIDDGLLEKNVLNEKVENLDNIKSSKRSN